MSLIRLSFTERRRRKLALKVASLDQLETRNTITEPISVLGLSVSAFRGLALLGIAQVNGGGNALGGRARPDRGVQGQAAGSRQARSPPLASPRNFLPFPLVPQGGAQGSGGA